MKTYTDVWLALAVLMIYFWGNPSPHDLVTLLVEQLRQGTPP